MRFITCILVILSLSACKPTSTYTSLTAEDVNYIMEKIQTQLAKCWKTPEFKGRKEPLPQTIIYIELDQEGQVRKVNVIEKEKYESDPVYRVLTDSAVWAIKECSPLKGLPKDKYEYWQTIEFTFDPNLLLKK